MNLRKRYWSYVFLAVALIYSTLYIMRPVCEFLKSVLPFTFLMNLFMVLLLAALAFVFARRIQKTFLDYVLMFFCAVAYFYGFMTISYPEEEFHFAEYGFLSFLIYRALRIDFKRRTAFIAAFFLTSLFGWIDEGIQEILPNRYYQLDDVCLNVVSGFLGLLLTSVFIKD